MSSGRNPLLATVMVTLRCSKCGAQIGVVRDLRFGLPPAGSLCAACSMPAYCRTGHLPLVRAQPLVALALRVR